ncbi:Holliday junction branch migration protein RuvA [Microbacterium excoecariae]|uniref:Holliday junction branch migration protein RuvA n=1 Tax=Microbacterium excoecariae TaxID=2715210 RepID=UPI001408E043|nr:Holliday junction branch migration protein RuvA [Microbacterium excoecariae]NHI17135.1 Holliday junction branch migration protein RuvA [Microbacterium excoecariae]
MIASVRGIVLSARADDVIIEAAGIGYAVACPPDVARTARVGEELLLHTHLIVREDAMSLVGFASREELDVFAILLSVTGVGPKSALGVLSSLTIDQIAEAVAADDDKPFRKVSGIGPKTAKLIALQLQGRIAPPAAPASAARTPVAADAQVVAALVGLGWPERTAAEAVAGVAEGASDADRASVPALLRLTLAELGPARQGAERV